MRIFKTQDVNLSVSASWKVEKFSLLKLFKIIENEYTTLIPMTKDYRSVIVVCRGICDEVKYTFDEFKKHFSDSTAFSSITFLYNNSIEENAYFYLSIDEHNPHGSSYACYVSITSSSLTEPEAEDFLKEIATGAIPFLSEPCVVQSADVPHKQPTAHFLANESSSTNDADDDNANHDHPNSKRHKKRAAFWDSAQKLGLLITIVVGIITILSSFGFRSCTQRNDFKDQATGYHSETYFE